MRATILPNGNLLVTASNRDRAFLADACKRGYQFAETEFIEALRPHTGYDLVPPEAVAGLADSPIIAEDAHLGDLPGDGWVVRGRVWWFPNYQITDPFELLARHGRVVFSLAEGVAA